MTKESKPEEQIRRWAEGIMAQASNPEVARTTRAVMWHARHLRDDRRAETIAVNRALAGLLVEPLSALGSTDPPRDSATMTEAAMGRMESLQWGESSPTEQDVSHLVGFLLSVVKGGVGSRKAPRLTRSSTAERPAARRSS